MACRLMFLKAEFPKYDISQRDSKQGRISIPTCQNMRKNEGDYWEPG